MNSRDPRFDETRFNEARFNEARFNEAQSRRDTEARAQAEAERAERDGFAPGADAGVDRYRLVVRALRQPLPPQLPVDFAARVAAIAERRGSGDGFEDWLVMLLMLAMGVVGLAFVAPALAQAFHALSDLGASHLPWQQLMLGAIGIGLVAAIERGWMRLHPPASHPHSGR